jgi:hypothetical protein
MSTQAPAHITVLLATKEGQAYIKALKNMEAPSDLRLEKAPSFVTLAKTEQALKDSVMFQAACTSGEEWKVLRDMQWWGVCVMRR